MKRNRNDKINICEIIAHNRLNKAHLARLMNMPVGTFKNKILTSLPMYNLTDIEYNKLAAILKSMAEDIVKLKNIELEL